MSADYAIRFGSLRIEKEIAKFLKKLPQELQRRLYDSMKSLGANPRPPQGLHLSGEIELFGYTARHRLRVGDYRVLYDVDDKARTVVILAVRRRSEKTYH